MIDRHCKIPLFIQVKQIIIGKISSGEWNVGEFIPTENEICNQLGISRYPVRQAMDELVKEGILQRTRGKGTTIINNIKLKSSSKRKALGLLMTNLTKGVNGQILTGFEKEARKCGYDTVISCSEDKEEEECRLFTKLIDNDIAGISVFCTTNTLLPTIYSKASEKGVYLSLIDRNPGINEVDYIGTDNMGGTYTAIHHLKLQGFTNVIFFSDASGVSSVYERKLGYERAVEDFGLISLGCINEDKYITNKTIDEETSLLKLKEVITKYKTDKKIGVFCVNDYVAMRCVDLCESMGLVVGKDVGIVGFDNTPESANFRIPITTIEQNSILVGKIAAEIAISKIEGRQKYINYNRIPTQLIIRKSCGEDIIFQ